MATTPPRQSYAIRRATSADAGTLAVFGAATFTDTFGHQYSPEDLAAFLSDSHSPAYYREAIGKGSACVFLASTPGGDPAGYVMCGPMDLPFAEAHAGAVELKRLYVSKASQGAGLGSRLIENALAWARERKASEIYLGVFNANTGAQRFYARYGFAKVGEYFFAVGKQRDHEFIMRRELEREPPMALA